MRIATGRVVDGKVVVEGEPLEEGATVTVLTADPDDGFMLDADSEKELLVALGQAQRREGVEGDAFLDQLDSY